jgi:hypothetical protein
MLGNFANRRSQLQTPVKPFTDLCDQAHGGFFPSSAALSAGVCSSPA